MKTVITKMIISAAIACSLAACNSPDGSETAQQTSSGSTFMSSAAGSFVGSLAGWWAAHKLFGQRQQPQPAVMPTPHARSVTAIGTHVAPATPAATVAPVAPVAHSAKPNTNIVLPKPTTTPPALPTRAPSVIPSAKPSVLAIKPAPTIRPSFSRSRSVSFGRRR